MTVSPRYAHGPETNAVPLATCNACGQEIPHGQQVMVRESKETFLDYHLSCRPTGRAA